MSSGNPRQPPNRHRRAGIVAIAQELGVSPSTVSNAYNRPDQLSPALREQVLRTAEAFGYAGPDPSARNLRRGRTGALGVVFAEPLPYPFDDATATAMLRGLAERAADEQFALLFVPPSPDPATRRESIRGAAVDGFILHSLPDDDVRLQVALSRRLPTVVIDSPRMTEVDFVGIDDRDAAASAVGHLLGLGHRSLGILSLRLSGRNNAGLVDPEQRGDSTVSVTRERTEGCAQALTGTGLRWDHVPLEECPSSTQEAGRRGTHELLDRAPPTTAIFAFSDRLALGALQAARERGLAVPGDLSVVGFDDTAAAAEGLTTVHQPELEKGRIAAERLAVGLSAPGRPERHILPTRLVVRETTGPPRTRD